MYGETGMAVHVVSRVYAGYQGRLLTWALFYDSR